ncbi:Serine/threonine-protein kinase-like protein [Emericellopsis cladophorae]|uniref:Autophagy-related protein 1 n=1 Tax=Emericellopsis cladophorae TaxID=2686198 RepID=A0A9P9Y4Z8_9HYPO|nr:Serine/threonine-protein kinase-like protein [Emericellopsis cladophorae]KAI6783688.1 Serine/threonine-protein kinase-like protein [Emericellopsis cladophorae]
MDGEEPTQATQNVLDPRRVGKQNSGFSDEDVSDIICVLYPHSDSAKEEVARLAQEDSPYIIGKDEADGVEPDYELEDHASRFESAPANHGNYAIILRLSAQVKNPIAGFAFGRNPARCDLVFANDPLKRVSNVHFRIYVNEYGNVMIEDQSTNGTFVDRHLLTSRPKNGGPPVTRWVLSSGTIIMIYLHNTVSDLTFRVRIPRRDDEYDQAYTDKVAEHFTRHGLQEDGGAAAVPVPAPRPAPPADGPPDIFKGPPRPASNPRAHPRAQAADAATRSPSKRREIQNPMRREWTGSGTYNKIGKIGKGAFAIVYKVTSKYNGIPYAAKELEKRRFIKDGVLDQKVENEMNIMKRIQHPNIVRYIENFDWDDRLLIIIMEYVPGGDLGKYVADQSNGPFSEDMAQTIAKQLLGALEYLHKNNITHRDVKPDNILLNSIDPLDVKLTDFGLSKMVEGEQTGLRTFCGTLLYCAPEVYTEYAEYDDNGFRIRGTKVRRMPGQRYNHAVDIWSLGGVLFFVLTKSPPYPVQNGVSYSELLHKIMTTRLNTVPLQREGVSERGIDFLSRMLQRRPENRATVLELDTHAWLGGDGSIIDASQSYDEITDDEEFATFSQQQQQPPQQDWREEDRVSDSGGDESEKENTGPGQPRRLFGEVGVSAVGSSGVIPDDFLNLPVSQRDDEAFNSYNDSGYDHGASGTPAATRTYQRDDRQVAGSVGPNQSADQLQSLVEFVASQSLNGHETAKLETNVSHFQSLDFTGSKRKPPSQEANDSMDSEYVSMDKPLMKRLKSEGNIEGLLEGSFSEAELLACVPQISRLQSGRQIDRAVTKTEWWTKDRSTWHLDYPEMTHLQFAAFKEAARQRGEEISPGKSPLWWLAMQHFPSTATTNGPLSPSPQSLAQTHIGALQRDERRASGNPQYFPPTAVPSEPQLPDTQPPGQQLVVPLPDEHNQRAIGLIESQANSCVGGISFPIMAPFASFGRHEDNIQVFQPLTESRVPKFAFKIVLWKDGYEAHKHHTTRNPYPWVQQPSTGDEDAYTFWISTKATLGIHVNGHLLSSDDPKNPRGPARNWMQLQDGDSLGIWGSPEAKAQTILSFRCFWGGSSHARQDATKPPVMAPPDIAEKLDVAYSKVEKRVRDDLESKRLWTSANEDLARREQNIERERERSRAFEMKRQEAIAFLRSKATQQQQQFGRLSRNESPASAPPASSNFGGWPQ